MKFLFLTDSHIKGKNPVSRNGDYYNEVRTKINEAIRIAGQYDCDCIIHGGDLFDSPLVSNIMVDDFVDDVEQSGIPWYIVWGNHDMIGHNKELSKASALAHIFRRSKAIKHIDVLSGYTNEEDSRGPITEYIKGYDYFHNIEEDIRVNGLKAGMEKAKFKMAIVHALITPKPFHPQVLHVVAKDIETNYDLVLCGHYHCVSDDTQILTENGWKNVYNLTIKDKIATLNLNLKHIEYQNLLNIHKYNYKGKMYNFNHKKHNRLDILVTPNHNMILNKSHKRLFPYSKLAYEIEDNDRLLLNVKNWKYSILHIFKNKYWAELIGFIIGDGTIRKLKNGHCSIRISQKIKNNRSYLKRLLKKCKLLYNFYIYNDEDVWNINYSNHQNKSFLNWICKNLKNKQLNRLLISLPKKQLKKLYKGLIKSDGHYYSSNWQMFYQKNINNIELFEELCLRIGKKFVTTKRKSNFQPKNKLYHVSVSNKTNTLINKKNNIKKVSYEGLIWCPEVLNGTWIAKRNGVAFITGNSYWKQQIGKTLFYNPGCIGRTSIDEASIIPKVLIIDTETKEINEEILTSAEPKEKVFDLERIEIAKKFENDIENFIKSLQSTKFQGLNLRGLIESIAKESKVPREIVDEVIERIGQYE